MSEPNGPPPPPDFEQLYRGALETCERKHQELTASASRERQLRAAFDALCAVADVKDEGHLGFDQDLYRLDSRLKSVAALQERVEEAERRVLELAQGVEDLLVQATVDFDSNEFIAAYHFKTGALHRLLGMARQVPGVLQHQAPEVRHKPSCARLGVERGGFSEEYGKCDCGALLPASAETRPTCDTPRCTNPIPVGGEGHPEICPTCLQWMAAEEKLRSQLTAANDRALERAWSDAADWVQHKFPKAAEMAHALRERGRELAGPPRRTADGGKSLMRYDVACDSCGDDDPSCTRTQAERGGQWLCADCEPRPETVAARAQAMRDAKAGPPECRCGEIQAADPARHFKGCPKRVEFL